MSTMSPGPGDFDDEPTTVPAPWRVPAPPSLDERVEAAQRNARLQIAAGPGQLRAALLALLLTPGSRREMGVWFDLCQDVVDGERLLDDVLCLSSAERVPWLERLAQRFATVPLDERKQLMRGARRLMAADGRIGAGDRLRWLLLRHALGDGRSLAAPAAAEADLSALDAASVRAVARWSAFLSRLVPVPEVDLDIAFAPDAPGHLWWQGVMAAWPEQPAVRERVDSDALVAALRGVQAIAWMLRPVMVRRWFDVAIGLSPEGMILHPEAADALRISAGLLDCPLPPPLAACFIECDAG